MAASVSFNYRNISALLLLISLFIIGHYLSELINGILIGIISFYLLLEIKNYGLKQTFLVDKSQTNRLFVSIKEGNLDEVKNIQKKIQPEQFLKL